MLSIKKTALACASIMALSPSAVAQSSPNILFLFADDLGYVDIHSPLTTNGHGSQYHQTPHIDQLAAEGMSFTHAYSQPNCQPTRAALLTGQYATRVSNDTYNVMGLDRIDKRTPGWPYVTLQPYEQRGNVAHDAVTFFEVLQSAGYHTSFFGKNHGTGSNDDLSDYHGIDHNYAANKKVKGKVDKKKKSSNYLALNDDEKGWIFDGPFTQYAQPYTKEYITENLLPYANNNKPMKIVGQPKHFTDAIGDAVVDYLEVRAEDKKPFIAYVPFHAVHSGIVARKDLHSKYKQIDSKDPRHQKAKYAALVEHLDQTIGRILDTLDKTGLDDNTLIVLSADNGGVGNITNNSPLRDAKGTFYEGGLRVPFIVKWPGVTKPSSVSNEPLHLIDLYPTFVEAVGAKLPSSDKHVVDGKSFVSLLNGKSKGLERDSLFWHFPGYMDGRNQPRSLIRKRIDGNDYKLIFSYITGEYEMYNLTKDISESNNLLENATKHDLSVAMTMNQDLIHWLASTNAPTGTWRVNGERVSYPSKDMVSYQIPDQTGLSPLKKEKKFKEDH